ncbi:MAG: sensor histidine kinase [Gemmatimonadaceae bacterium]
MSEVSEVPPVERNRFVKFFEYLPRFAAIVVIIIGSAVITGWAIDNPALRGIGQTSQVMPSTAVCFILCGLALLVQKKDAPRWATTCAAILCGMVLLFSVMTVIEHFIGQNLGLDDVMFRRQVEATTPTFPGRMAINTAAAFICVVLGILALPRDRRVNGVISQVAGFGAVVIAFVAVVGYAFGVRDFYSMQPILGMALLSAIGFLTLGMGLMFSELRRGLPGLLADTGAAGVVARRLVPGTIVLPFVFGMVRLAGEESGLFSSELATSLFAVADIVTFLLLVAWSARVLRNTDRKRAELFVRERDARVSSERARADAEAARTEAEAARAEAESANGAKSDFLAVMSHELRTPLSAIMGYQELLADGITGPVNEQQSQQLGRIKASARHLLSLIDEILTFTRIDAGREVVTLERASLASILEPAAEIVEPLARARSLHIEVMLPPNPVIVETDAVKVRQMIVNLLSNAVKFTDRGRIILSGDQAGDQLVISVEDTGIGIGSEHLERIFEPFWQVEQKATRRAGGTGLGLTVTRRLALLLGGDVTVKSTPGEGATFTICLPIHTSESSPLIARAAALHSG